METIFALASGAGLAGIAVYRISGPAAASALERLSGGTVPPARQAVLRTFRDSAGEVIDSGLVLWFPAPSSFTGEDVVELQLHGGRAVRAALYRALGGLPGLRPADAGEFTRRAFQHGRLDLTQAEGLADLIAAETEAQHRQALRQMGGALGARYDRWRLALIDCLAVLEAEIDFPDEDLPAGIGAGIAARLGPLVGEVRKHLTDGRRGERLREGVQVAIVGAPNVGKSSLLNALARREVAIVTPLAGTTRDVVEAVLDLEGIPAILADTAGLRDAADQIEVEGVRLARARADEADVRLVLLDASRFPDLPEGIEALLRDPVIVVANKTDLVALPAGTMVGGHRVHAISVQDGTGIGALLDLLAREVAACAAPAGEAGITRARHRDAVGACLAALERATAPGLAAELVAEDLRLAMRALGRITGQVDVEEVLDEVFARFCIGK